MIVLGVDPGYRNLGLSVVEFNDEGKRMQVLESKNMTVGKASAPLTFTKFLWPEWERLHKAHKIDGVASETPPFIMGQIRTTAFLWAVSSIIVAWAYVKDLSFRHASPIALKRGVCTVLDMPWDRKYIPKKKDVKRAVEQLAGEPLATSHENDAAFAAALMFSDLVK